MLQLKSSQGMGNLQQKHDTCHSACSVSADATHSNRARCCWVITIKLNLVAKQKPSPYIFTNFDPIRPKIKSCVLQVTQLCLIFYPDLNGFKDFREWFRHIVCLSSPYKNFEQNKNKKSHFEIPCKLKHTFFFWPHVRKDICVFSPN